MTVYLILSLFFLGTWFRSGVQCTRSGRTRGPINAAYLVSIGFTCLLLKHLIP